MINTEDIGSRYQLLEDFLGERGRRLFAANEALAQGYGGVSAVARATGIARSTVTGDRQLRAGGNGIGTAPAVLVAGASRRLCINRVCWRRLRH